MYVIGTNLEYIRVHSITQAYAFGEYEERVLLVEHGLGLHESPTFYTNKEFANKILGIIQDYRNDIAFVDKSVLSAIDENELDVSKLKVHQIITIDANKDPFEQLKEMIGEN